MVDLDRGGLVWAEWDQGGETEVPVFRASHTEILVPAATADERGEAERLEGERQEAQARLHPEAAATLIAYRNEVLATPMATFDEGVQAQTEWPGYAGSEKAAAHARPGTSRRRQ